MNIDLKRRNFGVKIEIFWFVLYTPLKHFSPRFQCENCFKIPQKIEIHRCFNYWFLAWKLLFAQKMNKGLIFPSKLLTKLFCSFFNCSLITFWRYWIFWIPIMIIGLLLRSIASVATLAWQRGDLLTDIIKAVFSLVLPVASDNLFFFLFHR